MAPPGRSLTGFGPASSAEKVCSAGGSDSGRSGVSYSSPFVLAPPRTTYSSLLDPVDRSDVLLCTYCLSADQRWLFASCTDSRGELLETTCINIDVPFRSQRRVFAVRRSALQKLWDFLIGVMSQTTTPWRIVIGRFGRLGHGELKGIFTCAVSFRSGTDLLSLLILLFFLLGRPLQKGLRFHHFNSDREEILAGKFFT